MSRELCGICMCPLDETGCGCPPEPEDKIPTTYEEYMASGIVSKMWEAGFIAGKVHEIQREIERKVI